MFHEIQTGEFLISDDPDRLDLDAVHAALDRTRWAAGMPREVLVRSIRHSIAFGVYDDRPNEKPVQVGFARVVTDRSTFAYLTDVVIVEEYRSRGLGETFMRHILAHPDLQGLRRFCLLTLDAQEFYAPFGFTYLENPRRYMERADPDVYRRRPPR